MEISNLSPGSFVLRYYVSGHKYGLVNLIAKKGTFWHLVLSLFVWDFWSFCWHYLNHSNSFLWYFHSTHHADEQMDVTSAYRFHVGEIFLSNILRIPLIVLFGTELHELVVYETLLFGVVQLHHANVNFPSHVEMYAKYVIPTPAMHKVLSANCV